MKVEQELSMMRTTLLALALLRDPRYEFTGEEISLIEKILLRLGALK